MNHKILFTLILVLLAEVLTAQTNIFTQAGNGNFETLGNQNDFGQFSSLPQFQNWTLSRTAEIIPASGSYSMKCVGRFVSGATIKALPSIDVVQVQPGRSYLVRAKVYVPADPGDSYPGMPVGKHLRVELRRDFAEGTGDILNNCLVKQKIFVTGTDYYDTWVDIYTHVTPNFSTPEYLHVQFFLGNNQGTFYVDKVEVFEIVTTEINLNALIDYNAKNINLTPTGGVAGWPYTYNWSDAYTGEDRTNLPFGTHSVTVTQPVLDPLICGGATPKTETYKFLSPPSIADPDPFICINSGTVTLQASTVEGVISWFDALVNGNLAGSGNTLSVGPFANPGTVKYYAQAISAAGKSPRSEAVVTAVAKPNPELVLSSTLFYLGQTLTVTAQNHQAGNQYVFEYNGLQIPSSNPQTNITLSESGIFQLRCRTTNIYGCTKDDEFPVEVREALALCQTILPLTSTGELKLDKFSGTVIFQRNDNCSDPVTVGCIGGKVESPLLNNVVSASATAFSDQWSTAYLPVALPAGLNSIEKSERGKWRPSSTHTFNKAVNYQASDKNYQAGRFQLAHFNWQYPDVNKKSGWLEVNKVDKYSPHGDPVEEHNALNVSSTAKFGYGGSVPYLIAQNAHYTSVYFEGFEKLYGSSFEENVPESGGNQNSGYFHSGKYSFQLTGQFKSRAFTPNDQLRQKGMQVRFWARGDSPATNITVLSGAGTAGTIKLIAQSGEWFLLESMIAGVPAGTSQFTVEIKKSGGSNLWIDDVRMQPADAEMTCYVYDPRTLRLLTVFDDQHFGMHYQYNAEGKLIRKMVETEKGIKTIQETQYNVPLIDKASSLGN